MVNLCPPAARHKECPVFLTLSLIANKWSIRLLYTLMHAEQRTMRFNQIQRAVIGITQRELSKHLREFEAAGIVERIILNTAPPKINYRLSDLGASLKTPIEALSVWAEINGESVQKNRSLFKESGNLP